MVSGCGDGGGGGWNQFQFLALNLDQFEQIYSYVEHWGWGHEKIPLFYRKGGILWLQKQIM